MTHTPRAVRWIVVLAGVGLTVCASSTPTRVQGQEVAFDSSDQPEVAMTDCSAKIAACCLCVQKNHSKAMKVTLKGISTAQKELLIMPQGGPAPEFDRVGGGRKRDQGTTAGALAALKCTAAGTTYTFDLYGGAKNGEFAVHIQEKGRPATRKLLGYLCVADPKKVTPRPLDMSAKKPASIPAGVVFAGSGCLPKAKAKPSEEFETLTQLGGKKEMIFIGKVSKTPPYRNESAPRLLKTWKFVCTEVQMWCVGGSFRFIRKDLCDPTGGFVKMGECVWDYGKNHVIIRTRKCRGGEQITFFRLYNVDMLKGNKGRFTLWQYDFCTGERTSLRCKGLNALPWRVPFDKWKIEHGVVDRSPRIDGGVTTSSQPGPSARNNIDSNN